MFTAICVSAVYCGHSDTWQHYIPEFKILIKQIYEYVSVSESIEKQVVI